MATPPPSARVDVPVSKSLRFKIFNRDRFVCRYCGRRPPQVTLECDHVIPRSKGGPTDEANLVTACYDCNRGKAAKSIVAGSPEELQNRIDGMEDRVEQMAAYAEHLDQILALKDKELQVLADHWYAAFETDVCDMVSRLRSALIYNPPHAIIEAIEIAAGKFPYERGKERTATKVKKYFFGILNRMRRDRA